MRRRVYRFLAVSSLLVTVTGVTRPHYGGELRIRLARPLPDLEASADSDADRFRNLFAETLVAFNGANRPEPMLATNWQHDSDFKRWRFQVRAGVQLHDGSPFTSASAAESLSQTLKQTYPEATVAASGPVLLIDLPRAAPGLLREIARARNCIVKKGSGGSLLGTGPFVMSEFHAGGFAALKAFENYWRGRAYLDAIRIESPGGAAPSVGDLIELSPSSRQSDKDTPVWLSNPNQLIALQLSSDIPAPIREAIALSIDRTPIANVLIRGRGTIAASLLPQWLSGYAFLFNANPDLTRARQLVAGLKMPLLFTMNAGSEKLIGDRIALNARDAGIRLQLTSDPGAQVRLVTMRMESSDPASTLLDYARLINAVEQVRNIESGDSQALYDGERALLDDHRLIPIVFVPQLWLLPRNVHNWEHPQTHNDPFRRLADVWLEQ
jgi:MarR-like DNA-binding transcriptional regulator SgrR of sgrS sRNA